MLSVDEAREVVRAAVRPVRETEQLALGDALGRVLAEPVLAERDDPPFDRATMDGFAVRAADLTSLPRRLDVSGEVAAGDAQLPHCDPGCALRINTGAPLPPGADTVVPVELTREEVEILEPVAQGGNIVPRGGFVRRGDEVASGRLTPERLAVCAAAGADRVAVLRRPRVAVLGTGSELTSGLSEPGDHEIRNSNGPMLLALCSGAETRDLGAVADDPEQLLAAVRRGLEADVLITTGGVSKGVRDYVPDTFAACGVRESFHRIALQPGKPVWFGEHVGGVVFGLPGNPVSALVCADLFVMPYLLACAGGEWGHALLERRARITRPIQASPKRRRVFPCLLKDDEVTPIPWRGSGDLWSAPAGNAYLVIPRDHALAAGDETVCLVPSRHAASTWSA